MNRIQQINRIFTGSLVHDPASINIARFLVFLIPFESPFQALSNEIKIIQNAQNFEFPLNSHYLFSEHSIRFLDGIAGSCKMTLSDHGYEVDS